ncbi:hypothetical protein FRX31_009071 [Thalictrum thalictroides]|uniref:Uncharacterized protein n=1 Tax=Thalictrum thalictroides TaxID=46969 RepID=A0A7J6WZ09_THATH|nr:hypothetical protein FRX31_009071 [Thalictrum thalictroides]
MLNWCNINRQVYQSPKECMHTLHACKGKELHHNLLQTAFTATIYWLWHERNIRIFEEQQSTMDVITRRIIQDVKWKLSKITKGKLTISITEMQPTF